MHVHAPVHSHNMDPDTDHIMQHRCNHKRYSTAIKLINLILGLSSREGGPAIETTGPKAVK